MEAERYSIYNRTRSQYLCREAIVLDPTEVPLRHIIEHLVFDVEQGVWLSPYRGIPPVPGLAPFDLICLDAESRVTEAVKTFTSTDYTSVKSVPESAVAVPLGSIKASGTRPGDKLLIGAAEQVGNELSRDLESPMFAGMAAADESSNGHSRESLRARFLRWLAADRRKCERIVFTDLVAFCWTGDSSQPFPIGDISESGLYLVTPERQYPGTRVLMTLQKSDTDGSLPGNSIAVQSKVVRWGNDGQGLSFIYGDSPEHLGNKNWPEAVADKKTVKKFLHHMKEEMPEYYPQ